ncbi:MAG: MFS transporter [Capnocytophaga sp.]|nr:MFS transporter [Capnocytophaga sp.]
MNQKNILWKLIPVMLSFFAMGFVDLVGIASNYMKRDFDLSESMAGLLPSMVFIWFLVFSVPTGMLMNRIGRRKTVLLSLVVTAAALVLPYVSYTYPMMLVFCCLLGIGNTLMQVSLNPLISNLVSGERLASSLTFGQFVKAIASFITPFIAVWAATEMGDWRLLFPIFLAVAILAVFLLGVTNIEERNEKEKTSSFAECFSLLGDNFILLSFIGILCHVGLDVGINVSAPKILMEHLGHTLEDASIGTKIYFAFRTLGAFLGAFILAKMSVRSFFAFSTVLIIIAFAGLLFSHNEMVLYAAIALIGFGNANIFSIFFSQALLHRPDRQNEVSGLMIMGISGGALFPFIMGVASDLTASQVGAIMVLCVTAAFFLFMIPKIRKVN